MSGKAATAAVKNIAKRNPIQLTLRPRDVAFAVIGAVGTFLLEPSEQLKEIAKKVGR